MIAEQLRKSILQAAIQGKLTEQHPEDGDARDLLNEIKKEKARLVKEGKIKKEKPLPEITDDEIPFDIPENWCWVRLIECLDVRDGTHDSPKYVSQGVPLVTSKNLVNGSIDFTTAKFISVEDAKAINLRSNVDDGDIIFAMIGSIGNPAIVYKDREFSIKNVALFKNINSLMNMHYVYYFLIFEQEAMKKVSSGGVQAFVSLNFLRKSLIPIPPLSEQHRIVERLGVLLSETEKLEEEETKLESLQKSFPKKMKDSILQYAIQGKLTEQLESDGDARDLLREIQKEKEQLIKEGKIKKEKSLPEITENEIPFNIPENWCWVRLGDVANYKKGPFGSSLTKSMFVPDGKSSIKVYEQKNAIQKDESLGKYYIDDSYYQSTMKGFTVVGGDIIISCAGTIGESYILPPEVRIGIINQALMRVRVFNGLDKYYFLRAFDYAINSKEAKGKGSAIKNIPPFEILKNILIPLPPIAEQNRIIDRLNQLLPLCDALE